MSTEFVVRDNATGKKITDVPHYEVRTETISPHGGHTIFSSYHYRDLDDVTAILSDQRIVKWEIVLKEPIKM